MLKKGTFVSKVQERTFFRAESVQYQVVIETNTISLHDKIVGILL